MNDFLLALAILIAFAAGLPLAIVALRWCLYCYVWLVWFIVQPLERIFRPIGKLLDKFFAAYSKYSEWTFKHLGPQVPGCIEKMENLALSKWNQND